MPTPADYRLMTEATGQRIAAALEALSGTPAAAAAARQNLDVYSTSETDAAIQQSTATVGVGNKFTVVDNALCEFRFAKRTGNVIVLSLYVKSGVSSGAKLVTIDNSIRPAELDYVAGLFANPGTPLEGSVWIEYNKLDQISYYGPTTTIGGSATLTYIVG